MERFHACSSFVGICALVSNPLVTTDRARGHRVAALERVNYAGLTARGLERGAWRHLNEGEVEKLRRKVGLQ